MTPRTIRRQHPAHRDDIDDLVTRRPVPSPELEHLDPFLFLNHHGPQVYPPGNRGLPFGAHPHRGFETVTFILQGELAHKDSGGHESVIGAGGVQWMTAGAGIVHAEISPQDFKDRGGPLEILQLWVNLPARLKFTEPEYKGLQRDAIPAVKTPDGMGTVHLIAGEWSGRKGPVESLTGVFMSTVELGKDARVSFAGLQGRSVFLYVVRGRVKIVGQEASEHMLLETTDGDVLAIEAAQDSVLLFGHAEPLREPVVSYGPFVMNSRREIQEAIADYEAGKFGTVA